jgi:hypothetical protein
VECAGYSFASKLERELFLLLKLMEKAGELKEIQVQCHVYLTRARIAYIADFKAHDVELGQDVYFEAKGFETPIWRIKRKLWTVYGPGVLRVYKAARQGVVMTEEIIPSGS